MKKTIRQYEKELKLKKILKDLYIKGSVSKKQYKKDLRDFIKK